MSLTSVTSGSGSIRIELINADERVDRRLEKLDDLKPCRGQTEIIAEASDEAKDARELRLRLHKASKGEVKVGAPATLDILAPFRMPCFVDERLEALDKELQVVT